VTRSEQRLSDLIDRRVPARNRQSFRQFLDTSDDDDLIGKVADLVEAGAIGAALKAIGDAQYAAILAVLTPRIGSAWRQFLNAVRTDGSVQAYIAAGQVEDAVNLINTHLHGVTVSITDAYSYAGQKFATNYSAMLPVSNVKVTFGQIAEPLRAAETAATENIYAASEAHRAAVDAEKAVATREAAEARKAAEQAMKSVQALRDAVSGVRAVPDDVSDALARAAQAAIKAADDADKLVTRANMSNASAQLDETRLAVQKATDAAKAASDTRNLTLQVEEVARGIRPSVGVTFNPGNPAAATDAQELAANFIRDVGEEIKDSVRNATAEALRDGAHPKEAARAYRDAVGLTDYQRDIVSNYRKTLERGSKKALNYALRDGRFDASAKNAKKKPLTPEQIDRMVERYQERYEKFRAETIAITEAGEATGRAGHESMRQTLAAGDFDPDTDVEKTWNATHDGRTRPSHWAMDTQKVTGLDALFTSGLGNKLAYPHDRTHGAPAKDTIRCRCVCTYRIL
jgi:hypothetical protein